MLTHVRSLLYKHSLIHSLCRSFVYSFFLFSFSHFVHLFIRSFIRSCIRLRQLFLGQKERSALPVSVRWSAPEVMRNPVADEEQEAFGTPCDVYSFSMVCWEMASYKDPFDDTVEEQVYLPPFSGVAKGGGACWLTSTWLPKTKY